MAIKSICDMHFGIQLDSKKIHFILIDAAANKNYFTLPPGTYYWDHPEARKNIVGALNSLFYKYLVFSKVSKNQLGVRHAGTDYAVFLNIENPEYEKLARMLGMYDNEGGMEYYGQVGIPLTTLSSTSDYVFQPTMNSFFSQSGRLHESPTLKGITNYESNEIQITQDGKSAVKSYNASNVVQNLTLTYLTGDDLKIDNNTHGTQDTLGTSISTWSAPFWVAYSPTHNTSSFFARYYDKDYKKIEGEWHLTDPISHESAVQAINRYAGLYNITFNATYHTTDTNYQKLLYFSPTVNPYGIVIDDVFKNINGNLFFVYEFIMTSHDWNSFLISGWRTSHNSVQWAIRFNSTSHQLRWWQGTLASNENLATGITLVPNVFYRLAVKRLGWQGTNNLIINLNGTEYDISTSKEPGTDGCLCLHEYVGATNYTTHGYAKKLYFSANYYPSDAQWEAAVAGDYGDPRKYTVAYHGDDYSGNTWIDHSGNDLHMALTATTREYVVL